MESDSNYALAREAMPQDMQPIVLCGPLMLEIDALVRALMEISPNLFTVAKFHYTDSDPLHSPSHYLSDEEFSNRISDDEFAVHSAHSEHRHGILKRTIIAGTAARRIVLILEANMRMVQQLKGWNGWDARYVFVVPPSAHVAEARWSPGHVEPGHVQVSEDIRQPMSIIKRPPLLEGTERMERAEVDHAMDAPETYDLILQSNNLDDALRSLVAFIWSSNQ